LVLFFDFIPSKLRRSHCIMLLQLDQQVHRMHAMIRSAAMETRHRQ
jgi:hypothetical protein